jgi:AraC family transcriptional regulator, ethanolamine operon transcriptional activator
VLRVRWFGSDVAQEHVAVSTRGVDLSTAGPATFYSATIDAHELECRFRDAPDVAALLEACQETRLRRSPIFAQRLRAYFQRLFRFPESVPRNASSGAPSTIIGGTLLPLLAAAVDTANGSSVEASRHLSRRVAAVRMCETYMREHLAAEVSLLDLSRASGIRVRSLINAFEAVTGLSPMVYLKRLRLSGARHALRHANKLQTRVIDIATDWGFWHMGHFAATYRAMFGETPSETLRNS